MGAPFAGSFCCCCCCCCCWVCNVCFVEMCASRVVAPMSMGAATLLPVSEFFLSFFLYFQAETFRIFKPGCGGEVKKKKNSSSSFIPLPLPPIFSLSKASSFYFCFFVSIRLFDDDTKLQQQQQLNEGSAAADVTRIGLIYSVDCCFCSDVSTASASASAAAASTSTAASFREKEKRERDGDLLFPNEKSRRGVVCPPSLPLCVFMQQQQHPNPPPPPRSLHSSPSN